MQDKVNILAARGDLDGAPACAAQLLSCPDLPAEQRRQLHHRMIERRVMLADWPGVEACCRAAVRDGPDDDAAWRLIIAQPRRSVGASWGLAPERGSRDRLVSGSEEVLTIDRLAGVRSEYAGAHLG
ncbi:hypothetical protein [Micromonospora saelicesensis]|uniref:hypothetical protein n=1 Tax=Micromonospora saelicesensis TaxID=285676 RepID=UPI000DD7B1C0|nr:hypothetical protein [Micromonospora saelicesensis]